MLAVPAYRNRYYDSEKGRFTQEDPIGLAGGVNVYGFANGDPVSYGDPYGLCPWYLPRGSGACILADAYQEHGIRGIVNEVIGVTPLAGDLNDAVVAVSGTNPITGEHVGRGGRGLAALAVAVPLASSSALRALGREARGGVFAAEALVPGRPFRGRRAPEEAYKHLQRYHGLDPNVASNRLHILKESYGLRPDDDVIIGRTGDVYNGHTGERLGSLTDPNLGGRKR